MLRIIWVSRAVSSQIVQLCSNIPLAVDLTMHAAGGETPPPTPISPIGNGAANGNGDVVVAVENPHPFLRRQPSIRFQQEAELFTPHREDGNGYINGATLTVSDSSSARTTPIEELKPLLPFPDDGASGEHDLASSPVRSKRLASSLAPERVNRHLKILVKAFNESPLAEGMAEEIDEKIQQANHQNGSLNDTTPRPTTLQHTVHRLLNTYQTPPHRATITTQFFILSQRTFKNLYRNPYLLLTHYIISILVAIALGLLFRKLDLSLSGFQNRMGVMFFICCVFGFGCLSSMMVFAGERVLFLRERANGYYSPGAYFASKVRCDWE